MSIYERIEYQMLEEQDCTLALFKQFNRCEYIENFCEDQFDERTLIRRSLKIQWDIVDKMNIVEAIREILIKNGRVLGVLSNGVLIGFATLAPEKFGEENEYIWLEYFHISYEHRNMGIGKRLFKLICEEARQMGAKKIYIASNASEHTQIFYKSLGCIDATYVHQPIDLKESYEWRLEYIL